MGQPGIKSKRTGNSLQNRNRGKWDWISTVPEQRDTTWERAVFCSLICIKINLWHASMPYEVNTSFEAGLWEQTCLEPLSESDKRQSTRVSAVVAGLGTVSVHRSKICISEAKCLLKMSLQLILQLFLSVSYVVGTLLERFYSGWETGW